MEKKSGSKKQVHLLPVRIGIPASYNTIWLKILQDNAFCTRLKKRPKISIFSTFINNENLQNFQEKKSLLGTCDLLRGKIFN